MATRTRRTSALFIWLGALGVVGGGCLTRPVVHSDPTTSTTFTAALRSVAIDKVDLLFVIDNSASMGDKQVYLSEAVPDLITRLVTPNCVDTASGRIYGPSDASGNCVTGTVEFPPVHDMHVGVISTSLGPRLSAGMDMACDPAAKVTVHGATFSNHNDDRGELLNRAGAAETPLPDAGSSFFLSWLPSTPANNGRAPGAGSPAIGDPARLKADFAALIGGVGNYGCGIESQLESWYRFLVQPDPYDSLALDAAGMAQWVGVDATILKQRHDFLRPDSLVAIIDMTDEDDSEIDVRSLGGQGYLWMNPDYALPRATSGCAENATGSGLTDPATCGSCEFAAGAGQDPSCQVESGVWSQQNEWGANLNLRHVQMTQKYGYWPQFPVQRYVLGLTSATVPDRLGEYPAGATSYQGLSHLDCTNPLFAASLPDGSRTDPATLCRLPAGTRTPDLVYYAHIGGVPHELLQQDPSNPDSPQKDTLSPADWVKILGADPLRFDTTGADPHMLESYRPRPGLPAPSAAPAGGKNPDPISGREWVTDEGAQHVMAVDREYACIFPLATPRDCTDTTDPSVKFACDCPATTGLTYEQLPPICNPDNPTQQIGAKAYPTVRELLLAKLLGSQGIVSSLCPIHVTAAGGDSPPDPLYGYRPAMTTIADRLKTALVGQCVPQRLTPDSCGNVPCLVLVTLPPGSGCSSTAGMSLPDPDVLAKFRQGQHDGWVSGGQAGADPSLLATCQLHELSRLPAGSDPATCPPPAPATDFDATGSCARSAEPGWCYVEGAAAGSCLHSVQFTGGEPPSGAIVTLRCLEQAISVVEAGGGGMNRSAG